MAEQPKTMQASPDSQPADGSCRSPLSIAQEELKVVSRLIRGTVLTVLTFATLNLFAGSTPVLAASALPAHAVGSRSAAPYVAGRTARLVCVAGQLCSQVVAQLQNPPATAALKGITQATLYYPGYDFGPVFLAHVGTPEGWAFYAVRLGDPIVVVWADGGTNAYGVVSIRGYRLVGSDSMQDLSTGQVMSNLDVYAINQGYPYLSLETCIPGPDPQAGGSELTLGDSSWGRMFITAQELPGW